METLKQEALLVGADDYRRLLEHVSEERLSAAFIGIWPSHNDFGRDLLNDAGAAQRLQLLPDWLQSFVHLDGEKFAAEMEADGHYVIADIKRGVCVFDGPIVRQP